MKFEKGDAVEMTASARKMFPAWIHVGTVTSLLGGHSIRVRRKGRKTAETWHDCYWRRAAETQSALHKED